MIDRLGRIRLALQALAPLHLQVVDESHKHAGHEGARDGRGHFAVDIISDAFVGMPPLTRHRRVYELVGSMMQTDIHALTIRARTSEESDKA